MFFGVMKARFCVRKRPRMIRRPKGSNCCSSLYTEKSVKHSDGVMVWGSFSGVGGWGSLYFLPKCETMRQDRYIQMLEDHMPPVELHGCGSFMQDDAPCHAAKSVKKWLNDQKINMLDWPGNSPDLNPLDNWWNTMKNQFATHNTSSVPHLIQGINNIVVKT
uniref:Tc1-like transposase DDE domain-containing protein n=1 Tax=Scylla olivacea TaxID=85551 RepID=A0A0P4WEJ0_SCYOL